MSNVQFLNLEFDLGDSDFRYLVEEHPLKITNCRHENWRDFLFAATNIKKTNKQNNLGIQGR